MFQSELLTLVVDVSIVNEWIDPSMHVDAESMPCKRHNGMPASGRIA